jgi:SanA protein
VRNINIIKKISRLGFKILLYLLVIAILILGIPRVVTALYSIGRIYTVNQSPAAPVAIVFGAGLQRDGSPTPVLRDRVSAAAELYKAGKVKKILMSGDNRYIDYNEPGSMRAYAISLGIPPEDIVLDYAGRRTYDTCYRAKEIFQLNDVLLVTQNFHLSRALFTCNLLGLRAVGVSADLREYRRSSQVSWHLRETPATLVALWEVLVSKPTPVLGNPEPIFTDKNDTKISR